MIANHVGRDLNLIYNFLMSKRQWLGISGSSTFHRRILTQLLRVSIDDIFVIDVNVSNDRLLIGRSFKDE